MSCYVHHMKNIFERMNIEYSTKNKKDMHVLMQEFSHEKDCPKVWAYIKPYVKGEEPDDELIDFIKRHWGGESKMNLDEQMKPDINRAPNAQ